MMSYLPILKAPKIWKLITKHKHKNQNHTLVTNHSNIKVFKFTIKYENHQISDDQNRSSASNSFLLHFLKKKNCKQMVIAVVEHQKPERSPPSSFAGDKNQLSSLQPLKKGSLNKNYSCRPLS